MSDMETHRGQLIPLLDVKGDTLEEQAKYVCQRMDYTLGCLHETWVECLRGKGMGEFHIHNGRIYAVIDEQLDPYGFTDVRAFPDGSIGYIIHYYNGGGSFGEVLDSALKYE